MLPKFNEINYPQYQDRVARIFRHEITSAKMKVQQQYNANEFLFKNITLQVTENCNLACTYCYQHNKTSHAMSFETAKKAIDNCLNDPDIQNKLGVIIDFIGGEPLLRIDLINDITEYYFAEMSKINLKLASRTMISICSNGLLYFAPKVQDYIERYKEFLSFSISIDGYKELHDSCRILPDGKPSYDICIKAAKHFMKHHGVLGTKMTFSKENIMFAAKGVINLIELGYPDIFCNCAYEPEWDVNDARYLYEQFKIIADYIIDGYLERKVYCSMFADYAGKPLDLSDPDDIRNWCGGNGTMLAIGCDGKWYPCLRFMPSAIGDKQPLITCGDIDTGIDHEVLKEMQKVTLITQSTDECIHCPVAKGCSWCTAYNYEVNGTINKRVTSICIMHKARSLINTYYYNRVYRKYNLPNRLPVYLPKEEAVKIISEEEYDMLLSLAKTEV